MKQNVGWITLVLLSLAMTIGISTTQTKAPSDQSAGSQTTLSAAPPAAAGTAIQAGPCAQLEERLQNFLLLPPDVVAAPDSCFPPEQNQTQKKQPNRDQAKQADFQKKAKGMRFAIATLPDPLYTRLPLSFDRAAEAIQQAAMDQQYVFDSSWLPWQTQGPSYSSLADQVAARALKASREDQPGIILFRKETDPTRKEPDQAGLAVLIVGEEPTGGIHRKQFQNAVAWIGALQPVPGTTSSESPAEQIPGQQIIGPSFSGSIPSLMALLQDPDIQKVLKPRSHPHLQIYSGYVTSDTEMQWLHEQASKDPWSSLNIEFLSFQQGDAKTTDLYCRFLKRTGIKMAALAIISEDQTAFGAETSTCEPEEDASDPKQGPVHLYYPRDISALRAAYQAQSIFSASASQPADNANRTLQPDVADPEGDRHDTLRNYSGDQTALSQESGMQQIVSMLRAHRSEYLLLRSSNPLDQLFLSHYFRRAYPEGRIVILGADTLLRRESGSSALNGIETLSTYPLLPWEPDWTKSSFGTTPFLHVHRVFTNDGAEGVYVAATFLFHQHIFTSSNPNNVSLPPDCDEVKDVGLRNYAPPFWTSESTAETGSGCTPPPLIWLSVLGNGGFWPISALDDITEPAPPSLQSTSRSSNFIYLLLHSFASMKDSIAFILGLRTNQAAAVPGQERRWLPMPLIMKLCLAALFLWAGFHAFSCSRGSITVKPAYRAHFVRPCNQVCMGGQKTQQALVIFGCVLVSMAATIVAWGYGEMSEAGEPLLPRHSWAYRLFLVLIWSISAFALCANVLIEERYWKNATSDSSRNAATKDRKWLYEQFAIIRKPLLIYVVMTSVFYWFIDISLDCSLNEANRIPTYWRSMNLASGVSPLAPLLALTAGLYTWFWCSLHGLALFAEDRPRLPSNQQLVILRQEGRKEYLLHILSSEGAAHPTENLCMPLHRRAVLVALGCFVVIVACGALIFGSLPIRSLGSDVYSRIVCLWAVFCISILFANAWQMVSIWLKLRQLLLFLDKLPLRRTLEALKGFSWGSVWKMSGSILDVRYKLVFRQLESLTHLRSSLQKLSQETWTTSEISQIEEWISTIGGTLSIRQEFARWYSDHWSDWTARDSSKLKAVQNGLAATAAMALTQILIPAWREESHSLVLESASSAADDDSNQKEDGRQPPVARIAPHIRNAEELVGLIYLGYIQNVLGRIRSLTVGIICLFVAMTVAVSSYAFDPRPLMSGTILVLFFVLAATVVTVYSQMHRDVTLSNLTDTKPGELGADFWLKLVGFGIGPVLGLLTSVFPELSGFFLSWLQPGLESIK